MSRCVAVVSQSQVEDVQWSCAVSWQIRNSIRCKRNFTYRSTNRNGVNQQKKALVLVLHLHSKVGDGS